MSTKHILDNLSTHLKHVIAQSIAFAAKKDTMAVTPVDLLYCIATQKGSVGAEILAKTQLPAKTIKTYIDAHIKKIRKRVTKKTGEAVSHVPELTHAAKKALEKAMIIAYEYEHTYIGTEHLLHGLLEIEDPDILAICKTAKIEVDLVYEQISIILSSTSKFPDIDEITDMLDAVEPRTQRPPTQTQKKDKKTKRKSAQKGLDMFAVCLTDKDIQETIDPVIGRENEIDQLIHILCRRTKNNPVLVGEPGVGKTAIVEGLAKRIYEGSVPHILKRKKIYSLDLALLISGTIYRGEFESRIKQVIDELSALPDTILFIDELHNIIGTGSNQGTMDAANILKPALARGKLRCIGATTVDEYKKYISKDPALERRFQSIDVQEPTEEETAAILKGIAKYYNTYHKVNITPKAITKAIQLSTAYIHDNQLPDKAIDLLDEAAAHVNISRPVTEHSKEEHRLIEAIAVCEEKKELAIDAEEFKRAIVLKEKQQKLEKQLHALQKKIQATKKTTVPKVEEKHVAHILAKKLGIPESQLLLHSVAQIQTIGDTLNEQILGQTPVVAQIVQTLQQAHIRPHHAGPLASFLFAGPSGVGKTQLAKLLAEALYHNKKALIKFDMSEFSEGHSVSKLLGSPAGYVGHKERNRFTEQLKQRPHAVILFDEIDKAHPDVIKLLLQILDEGELTDSSGKKMSFAHAVVILTTNLGSEFYTSAGIGFGTVDNTKKQAHTEKHITAHIRETLNPSLVGRLDKLCLFSPLTQDTVERIVQKQLHKINHTLKQQHGFTIATNTPTLAKMAKKAYNTHIGARHIEKVINTIVTEQVVSLMNKKKRGKKKQYTLRDEKNGYVLV